MEIPQRIELCFRRSEQRVLSIRRRDQAIVNYFFDLRPDRSRSVFQSELQLPPRFIKRLRIRREVELVSRTQYGIICDRRSCPPGQQLGSLHEREVQFVPIQVVAPVGIAPTSFGS